MRQTLLILSIAGAPLGAATELTLQEAVRLALVKHPAVEAGAAGIKASETRLQQARSGYLPKVNYAESWQRSNNPVFVFSSLLTQHQFTERNFLVGPLNRPDSMNNFQSQLTVDQPLYDAGQTRTAVRQAELGRTLATEDSRRTSMEVIAGAARAYYGAVLAAEALRVADEALRSAEADLARAENVRAAGMSTDADVLSIRVHLAAVKEQRIRRAADLELARAALNDALGAPLDTPHDLTTPLTAASIEKLPLDAYQRQGLQERPEARQARLSAQLAETQSAAARSALLPTIYAHAGFEADRERFATRGGANWMGAVGLRWNLFNGFQDRARIAEAAERLHQARALERHSRSGIQLQVQAAYLDFRSAQERIEVAAAAVAMAEESLRITKNRYQNGLTTVTDLLRNETALLEARTRRLGAVHDQRLAATLLELAAGTLSSTSGVLQ